MFTECVSLKNIGDIFHKKNGHVYGKIYFIKKFSKWCEHIFLTGDPLAEKKLGLVNKSFLS